MEQGPTKILIISDAWHPQVNGVVRTLESTTRQLQKRGHQVRIIGPDATQFWSFAAPSYPSITLEFFARGRLLRVFKEYQPDLLHIATEGPLGWAARNMCLHNNIPFTTSYHTRFPEYLAARVWPVFSKFVRVFCYAGLRRFHTPSSAIMVATDSIARDLHKRKFRRIAHWSRGVDTTQFQPYGKDVASYANLPRPILLYVGRVAVEKNLRAFLDIKCKGSKVVIGDGPDKDILQAEYPNAHFLGSMDGEKLGRHYAAADLFVFPSTTDTFGLVLLEACAAGLRVASYPAPGPVDIFAPDKTQAFAVLDSNLEKAALAALALPDAPEGPRHFAESFSWESCTNQFFHNLQAPTPKAIKRITRVKNWLSRWWQHGLALLWK